MFTRVSRRYVFLASAFTIGSMFATVQFADGQERKVKQYTIDQFLETTNYNGASFSHDNSKILVNNDSTGVFNAYSIEISTGKLTQITNSDNDSIYGIGYFPQDDRILYTADQGGDELNHVFVQLADGTSRDLTPGDGLKANFSGWSTDDTKFYIATNERDPRFFDIYEYEVAGFSRQLIYQNDDGYFPGGISPDGNLISLVKVETRDNSDVFVYNRTDKSTKCVTAHEGDISHSPMNFTPDSDKLLITTDEESEFKYLVQVNLATAEKKRLAKYDWDIAGAGFSKHGKFFQVRINEDAKTKLVIYEYPSMEPVDLPEIKGASITSAAFSRDEDR